MKVVVVGGGIVGCSTAYYLSKLGADEVVLVEQERIACASSGKAGGFLAREWQPEASPLGQLSRQGFDLIADLADELGPDLLQYRRIHTFQGRYQPEEDVNQPDLGVNQSFEGLVRLAKGKCIGAPENTAQVTPYLLTKALFDGSNCSLVVAKAIGLNLGDDGRRIASLRVRLTGSGEEEELAADAFCFCLGPWSSLLSSEAFHGLRVPETLGLKVHSVVLKKHAASPNGRLLLPPVAVFTDFNNSEVYPRPDGKVYINGSEAGYEQLTPDIWSKDVKPVPGACEKIMQFWLDVADDQDGEGYAIVHQQACHLPTTKHLHEGESVPVLSAIPEVANGYVAAGHSCWGILVGPRSGMVMAQLILGEKTGLDMEAFTLK